MGLLGCTQSWTRSSQGRNGRGERGNKALADGVRTLRQPLAAPPNRPTQKKASLGSPITYHFPFSAHSKVPHAENKGIYLNHVTTGHNMKQDDKLQADMSIKGVAEVREALLLDVSDLSRTRAD
jgi:hypothetical protein